MNGCTFKHIEKWLGFIRGLIATEQCCNVIDNFHVTPDWMSHLDQWLESLRDCIPLKESEIKQMCEMVYIKLPNIKNRLVKS